MLNRCHIIALDDLRAAAAKGSAFPGRPREGRQPGNPRRVAPGSVDVAEL